METRLEDAYVLIHEKDDTSSMKDLLPVLESIAKTGKPLLTGIQGIWRARPSQERWSLTRFEARSIVSR